MILGGRLFISCTSTGTYLDVENGCDDDTDDGRDDKAVVEEEEIGDFDLDSHWRRRSGPAARKPLGCIADAYLYKFLYIYYLFMQIKTPILTRWS